MSCSLPTHISLFRSGMKLDDGNLIHDYWDVSGDITTQQVVDRATKCGDLQAHTLELGCRTGKIIWDMNGGFLIGAPDLSFFSLMTMIRGDSDAYPSETEGYYVMIARF